MKAIIIDDEQHAIDLLLWQLREYCPAVQVVAKARSASAGVAAIRHHEPELVLLDVDMPNGDGFHLLDQLQPVNFDIIFTTAYSQYALKAFRYAALDYLLKPIDGKELAEAVNRCTARLQHQELNSQISVLLQQWRHPNALPDKVSFATQEAIHFVDPHTIQYCESKSNYTILVFVNNDKLVVSRTLRDVEELLVPYGFLRIHHSFLVNLKMVSKYHKADGGAIVLAQGVHLPVSRQRRDEVMAVLGSK